MMSQQCCKFCGNEFDASTSIWSLETCILITGGFEVKFTPSEAIIFDALYKNVGKCLSNEKLLIALYGGYGEEPDNSYNVVSINLHKIRKKIKPLAWKLANTYQLGYTLEIRQKP